MGNSLVITALFCTGNIDLDMVKTDFLTDNPVESEPFIIPRFNTFPGNDNQPLHHIGKDETGRYWYIEGYRCYQAINPGMERMINALLDAPNWEQFSYIYATKINGNTRKLETVWDIYQLEDCETEFNLVSGNWLEYCADLMGGIDKILPTVLRNHFGI